MITHEEARQQAQDHLDRMASPLPLVLTGDQEFAVGWVFFYDSERHQESGDLSDAIAGNSPILVDREDGTTVSTGTAHPVERYVEAYSEARRRRVGGWPEGLTDRLRDLIAAVRDGAGRRDARGLDRYISRHHEPTAHTVLEELHELERRGLVARQPDDLGGVGNRWRITPEGLAVLDDRGR